MAGFIPRVGGRPSLRGTTDLRGVSAMSSERKIRKAERYAQRKGSGFCTSCPNPSPPGAPLCQACSQARRYSAARRSHRLRAEGRCIHCGGAIVPEDTNSCRKCKDRMNANKTRRRQGAEGVERQRIYGFSKRFRRRRQGVCTVCAARPSPGFVTCSTCQSKDRERRRRLVEKRQGEG